MQVVKNSKFDVSKLNLVAVATGVKGSNDVEATITVQGIPNKFQLNKLATSMMGLKIGDRVRIFRNNNATTISDKFFIAKMAQNDTAGTAKVSKSNSTTKLEEGIDMAFNYSGVWAICLQGDPNAAELGFEALEAKGLVIKKETSGGNATHRSTVDVKFTIEEVGMVPVGDVEVKMFALTNFKSSAKSEEELSNEPIPADVPEDEDEDIDEVDE